MEKISAVYKIVNTVTGDSYVGSSRDVMKRWASHREPSRWKKHPNIPLYHDFQKYGQDKFRFQILAPVEPEYLKQVEQEFIEMLKPTYNNNRAKGRDVERWKEYHKEYSQTEKCKEYNRKYNQSANRKEYNRKYKQSEKCKEYNRKYNHQLCSFNGEILTLQALAMRFKRAGIEHSTLEAKKYLING